MPITVCMTVTTRIFLRHTADIRSDSGCPTPCDRCDTLHYRTPCTQLGQVSRCFPFLLQLKYFSDILRTSGRTPDVRPCAMATAFCIIGQLVPNSAKRSNGFPFCYNSNISLIYCGRPVGLRMSDSAQWPRRFLYYRTTRAQLGRVFRCFSFRNISPFLLPDLFSLLPCLSN